MSTKACVLLADGFETVEALATVDVLRRAKIDVTIAGVTNDKIKSDQSITVECDVKLMDVAKGDLFDILILPGGYNGSLTLGSNELAQECIKRHLTAKKWVAAICAAPALSLAKKGLLGNAKGICYPAMIKDMGDNFVETSENVYVDSAHHIITSRGPGTVFDFALKIVEIIADQATVDKVRSGMLL